MGEVKAVKVSPDGKTLVSCSADGTLKAWDMETEKLMYTCTGHKNEVRTHIHAPTHTPTHIHTHTHTHTNSCTHARDIRTR